MFSSALAGMGGLMAPRGPGTIPSDFPEMPSGMFGAGKRKFDAAGLGQALIGGYLAGRGNPGGNAILGMMSQRQQQAMQEQQYQQRRGDQFEDWVKQQAWQRANPNPVNNDTVADYNFWKQTLPPKQFEQWLESKVNPPQLMNIPGVGVVSVPRQGGAAQAPTAPVGKLTPLDEGGPMPSASGGFRSPGY
jgi:hypothetical protein